MIKKNILVFPCGSEIAFEVYNSLKVQKDINLIGASSIEDNGRFVFENYIGDIPMIDTDEFIPKIKEIISNYKIDFIYPCIDVAISKLKLNESELGCNVIGSDIKTVEIVSSKKNTYDFFNSIINVPKFIDIKNIKYPIFSKPNIGSSSRNTMRIDDDVDLKFSLKKYPNNLLVEYLPGKEFTIDCFTDAQGKLIYCKARERKKIINGISVNTIFIYDSKINDIANIINNSLNFFGSWFFQLKKDKNNEYCLLEIASRFGGSSLINRILGINFAYLNILMYEYDVSILENSYDIEIGRSLDVKVIHNLNYDNVYIDLDDTILVNNSVNIDVIRFLYKCFNQNKSIFLITKHQNDINETLDKFNISKSLFKEIIQLSKDEKKSNYITREKSIFIDDSFSERKEVFMNKKITTISVENINFI